MHCWLKLKKHKWKHQQFIVATGFYDDKHRVEVQVCECCKSIDIKFLETFNR
jgi:hypothetical protein